MEIAMHLVSRAGRFLSASKRQPPVNADEILLRKAETERRQRRAALILKGVIARKQKAARELSRYDT